MRLGVALLALTFFYCRAARTLGAERRRRKTEDKPAERPRRFPTKSEKVGRNRKKVARQPAECVDRLPRDPGNISRVQRQDESRAVEMVGKRKELLAMDVIAKRELEDGERALVEAQGKVAETMGRFAEVEQYGG